MMCCLLAAGAMVGAGLARWRRLIGGATALVGLGAASAALAWSLTQPDHNVHDVGFSSYASYCGGQ